MAGVPFIQLTDSGLQIASRSEIYNQLALYAKEAYGSDLLLTSGSSFDVFLQLLADGLSTVNGSVQSFSELLSTKELSGNFLDFIASRRGVLRKRKSSQRVTMTVTLRSRINKPFTAPAGGITVIDSAGRSWVNTTQLVVQPFKFEVNGQLGAQENFQGTCEFGLLPLDDPSDTKLLYAYNDGHSMGAEGTLEINFTRSPALPADLNEAPADGGSQKTLVLNYVNATAPVPETENDAQFRARYDAAVYSKSISTLEGLRSKLLEHSNYVRIVENSSSSGAVNESTNPYGLAPHSVWVIVDSDPNSIESNFEPPYSSTSNISGSSNDVYIAQTILNYKSLGCGVSLPTMSGDNPPVSIPTTIHGQGNFACLIPQGSLTALIPFTRLVSVVVTVGIKLNASGIYSSNMELKKSVAAMVKSEVGTYLAGLEPGEVVTTVGLMNAIYSVLNLYPVGAFDCDEVPSILVDDKSKNIQIFQKAVNTASKDDDFSNISVEWAEV